MFILLFLAGSVRNATAQQTRSFHEVDSLTFALYEQQQWKELVKAGRQAVNLGHDYFFMRMRTGIAYFMLQQYRAAAPEFEKALEYNTISQVAYDYLRLSYLWGGLETEAVGLERRFSSLALNSENLSQIIREITLYSGTSFSGGPAALSEIDLDGLANLYGEGTANGNFVFVHAGLKVVHSPPYIYQLGFTHIRLARHQRFVMDGADTLENKYTLKQNQVFLNMPFRLAKGWHITPALNLINVSEQPLLVSYDTIIQKYNSRKTDRFTSKYILSLRAVKETPFFNVGLAAGNSNMNDANQWQGTFLAGVYPFANLNLYGLARVAALAENNEVNWHFRLIAGSKVNSRLWLQGSHHFGHLKNAHDENGLLLFNNSGEIISRTTATAFFLIDAKLTLQLDYSFVKQQDQYIEYLNTSSFILNSFKYNNHHIMGGLKWKL